MRHLSLGAVVVLVVFAANTAHALQMIPTKNTYATNESIRVLIYNDSNDWVSFTQPGSIWAVNLDTGFVHGFISLAIVYDLWPGMFVNLRLGAAIPMEVGEYELVLVYKVNYDPSNIGRESVFISIEDPVDNAVTSTGRLKSHYKSE